MEFGALQNDRLSRELKTGPKCGVMFFVTDTNKHLYKDRRKVRIKRVALLLKDTTGIENGSGNPLT
jgi:hypothetical protein